MIEAKIILDSISREGHRLTTFLLRYPKFIHGELMTHRVFSRNASSSRAVPVTKNIKEVRDNVLRAQPVYWGAEQRGMQSGGELRGDVLLEAQRAWEIAAWHASDMAEDLVKIGAHKSIVNRVLEPFLHINVLVTATEYMNFFGLRLDKAAQPEMRVLAETMWHEYSRGRPRLLLPGEWHLPFIPPHFPLDRDDVEDAEYHASWWSDVYDYLSSKDIKDDPHLEPAERDLCIKISVARCARLSYMSFETGKRSTIEEDLKLHDKLVSAQPLHASPAEHQATPDERNISYDDLECGNCEKARWRHLGEWGNFIGWRQYRKTLAGEAVAPLPEEYR